jgi:hypothetical protein
VLKRFGMCNAAASKGAGQGAVNMSTRKLLGAQAPGEAFSNIFNWILLFSWQEAWLSLPRHTLPLTCRICDRISMLSIYYDRPFMTTDNSPSSRTRMRLEAVWKRS